MPRFALLEHDWPTPHWDFLLEAGPVLRAWRLAAQPAAGVPIPADANFDHRLAYLDYEGPLSGDRGCVVRRDAGTFAWVENDPGRVIVTLCGAILTGRATIDRQPDGTTIFRLG